MKKYILSICRTIAFFLAIALSQEASASTFKDAPVTTNTPRNGSPITDTTLVKAVLNECIMHTAVIPFISPEVTHQNLLKAVAHHPLKDTLLKDMQEAYTLTPKGPIHIITDMNCAYIAHLLGLNNPIPLDRAREMKLSFWEIVRTQPVTLNRLTCEAYAHFFPESPMRLGWRNDERVLSCPALSTEHYNIESPYIEIYGVILGASRHPDVHAKVHLYTWAQYQLNTYYSASTTQLDDITALYNLLRKRLDEECAKIGIPKSQWFTPPPRAFFP